MLGIGCILAMLGFSVNVLLGLWMRSTVDSIAYDAARSIATAPPGTPRSVAAQQAIDRAKALMGPSGDEVRLSVESSDEAESVVLRLQAPGVRLLPSMLGGAPIVGDVDRRIVVRVESP